MKGIKKILVPLDFSDCSRYAFHYALDIAGVEKAELYLLHVIDSELLVNAASLKLCPRAKAKKILEKKAKAEFTKLRKDAAKKFSHIIAKEIIEEGIPFIQILNEAREFMADMIVMGNSGTSSPVMRLFFGTTTAQVLKGARIPVLCVPLPRPIER